LKQALLYVGLYNGLVDEGGRSVNQRARRLVARGRKAHSRAHRMWNRDRHFEQELRARIFPWRLFSEPVIWHRERRAKPLIRSSSSWFLEFEFGECVVDARSLKQLPAQTIWAAGGLRSSISSATHSTTVFVSTYCMRSRREVMLGWYDPQVQAEKACFQAPDQAISIA
jgi:hypothetical protein